MESEMTDGRIEGLDEHYDKLDRKDGPPYLGLYETTGMTWEDVEGIRDEMGVA